MTRINYTEALEENNLDIKDKYLVIDTIQDGYFNIFKGVHPYRVIEDDNDELAVYPVYWTGEGKLTNEPHPIIRTLGEDVLFVKRHRNDPYNGPDMDKILEDVDLTIEHKVLEAFKVFADSEFTLGHPNPIHVFIGDGAEVGITDEPVEFELRDIHGEIVEVEEEEEGDDLGE